MYRPAIEKNYAFLCPHCGRRWHDIVIDPKAMWNALRCGCENCPAWPFSDIVPGSILGLWFTLDNLPPGEIEREFNLHLRLAQKELENAQG